MIFETEIDGRTFSICTERDLDVPGDREWHAWCFFAYDKELNIYPADTIPEGVRTQESIAGGSGKSQEESRAAVEKKLRTVMETKKLDGMGFYSPPADRTYPPENL